MSWVLPAAAVVLLVGEVTARLRGRYATGLATLAVVVFTAAFAWKLSPDGPWVRPVVVGLLGLATMLARPPVWRASLELGVLLQTTLLVALVFCAPDLPHAALLWMLTMWPGLRSRQEGEVSRRPSALRYALSALPVLAGFLLDRLLPGASGQAALYLGVVIGGAARMGVAPISPLTLAEYARLPLGRAALAAAARPSVALLLAARQAVPHQVEVYAGGLQLWAALAAVLVALQGLAATGPRRQIGHMATTQSAIILYGLVSAGEVGVMGALVQWIGLGASLIGTGLVVEAVESRVGRRRAARVRGLLGRTPVMALFFLLFAATMAGFPGTPGFIGEDMILQSEASHGVVLRAMLLLATALNGLTMLGLFSWTFLGRLSPPEASAFPRMATRERIAFAGLCLLLVLVVATPGVAGP